MHNGIKSDARARVRTYTAHTHTHKCTYVINRAVKYTRPEDRKAAEKNKKR